MDALLRSGNTKTIFLVKYHNVVRKKKIVVGSHLSKARFNRDNNFTW